MTTPGTALQTLIKDLPFSRVVETLKAAPYHLKVKARVPPPNTPAFLFIVTYDVIRSDMANPVVQEARGIILEHLTERAGAVTTYTNRVVARAFDKFFNYHEPHAAQIDHATAVVEEKLDGSILKWYFWAGKWWWASMNCLSAAEANLQCGHTLQTLTDQILTLAQNTVLQALDPALTYVFELIHPLNQIVIRYDVPELVFLAAVAPASGVATYPELQGFSRPKQYPRVMLTDLAGETASLPSSREGYVVRDAYNHRIKVKGNAYTILHRIARGSLAVTDLFAAVLTGAADDLPGQYHDETERIRMKLARHADRYQLLGRDYLTIPDKATFWKTMAVTKVDKVDQWVLGRIYQGDGYDFIDALKKTTMPKAYDVYTKLT